MREYISLRAGKYFNAFWIIASLLWFPLCFINFDPHHDGIILTTVNQLKLNMQNGGPWPFNQYGSAWAFPYLLISYLVPHNFLLLSMRLLTVSFYIIATYFLYKSAIIVYNKRTAQISVAIFLGFQPFLGPWNTSLLPWPSSLVVLLVSLLTYVVVTIPGAGKKSIKRKLTASGILIGIILGSRIQVGLLLLISMCLAIFSLQLGKIRYLTNGVFLWVTPFSFFLALKGWLLPSLYDSLILGGQFLSSDHLHYPLPLLSVIAGVCTFIWLELAISHRLNKYHNSIILLIAFFATIILSKRVLEGSFSFANYLSVTQRKILAALFFTALIEISWELFRFFLKRSEIRHDIVSIRKILLYGICLCSSVQAWPFFDQMHIWWSFIPSVVIIADRVAKLSSNISKGMKFCALPFAIVVMSFLVISQFSISRIELKSINQNYVFVDANEEKNELGVQVMIEENIPRGSRVLNLCPNAYPFFKPGLYQSVSRFFVYWSNFESAPISYRDYSFTNVKYVLDCDTYLYQGDELMKYNLRKARILESIPDLELIKSVKNGGFNWQILSVKNS